MPLSRPSAFAQRQVVNRKYTASIKTRGCSIFVRNFNKFKHITVISGKQHHENAAKLLLQRTATLTNQCSTLPCKNSRNIVTPERENGQSATTAKSLL